MLDLKTYLSERAQLVNRALERLLPAEDEFPESLYRAMRYSLFAGGKRLRPVLVLASAEAVGGSLQDAMNIACAFECVHTYSLIHDDLPAMDNDDLRRGMPTCHKAFGEATAILAGDALLTIAFEMVADTPIEDKERLLRVVKELAHAAGCMGMIKGQALDMEAEGTEELSFPLVEDIHIHKTGALITSSVRCGAIIGGADQRTLEHLTEYGRSIGLAFQIMDDILDVEGSEEEMGKKVGADEKKKKATYPALVGLSESKRLATELVERAVDSLSTLDERAEPLRALARFIVERKR